MYGGRAGMAVDSGDEHQLERAAAHPYPAGDAGKGFIRPETPFSFLPFRSAIFWAVCLWIRYLNPLWPRNPRKAPFTALFGSGKGSGAAMLFLVLAFVGELTCLIFRKDRHIWALEKKNRSPVWRKGDACREVSL